MRNYTLVGEGRVKKKKPPRKESQREAFFNKVDSGISEEKFGRCLVGSLAAHVPLL